MLFVYYNDYPPITWTEDGILQGIYIDIVNEAFKRIGIPVKHNGYPWKRAQMMVISGEADGFCTVVTPKCLSFSYATKEPIIEVDFKIYEPANTPRLNQLKEVKTIADLKGFKLTDYSGSGWAKTNLSELDIQWLPTNKQIWGFLILGRAEATVKNMWTTRYILKKLKYNDKIVELPLPMNKDPITFHIFIGKKSPFSKYIGKLDDIIKQMRQDGTLNKIYNKNR